MNGKKIGAIFRNGKAISQVFRNGKLVWQKAKPVAKRVKSITVALPEWGTPERIEWESILRAVPADIRNYYLDAMVKGIGVRLRGNGGKYTAELSGETIVLTDGPEVSTDEVYVGMAVSFIANVPAVKSSPTYKKSDSSYRVGGRYEFEGAPFMRGSSLSVAFSSAKFVSAKVKWTVYGNLLSADTAKTEPAVTVEGRDKSEAKVVYSGENYDAMASFGTAAAGDFRPSFHVNRSEGGKIGAVTLHSPACRLTYKFKIKQIETY